MTGQQPARKGTILIPSGPVRHLHFVCSDPVFYPRYGMEAVLVVNISTIKADCSYDATCVLNSQDHPFITNPSYVFYYRADIFSVDRIAMNIADGTFQTHQDCNDATFQRILAGFNVSPDVKGKVLSFYRKYCV